MQIKTYETPNLFLVVCFGFYAGSTVWYQFYYFGDAKSTTVLSRVPITNEAFSIISKVFIDVVIVAALVIALSICVLYCTCYKVHENALRFNFLVCTKTTIQIDTCYTLLRALIVCDRDKTDTPREKGEEK